MLLCICENTHDAGNIQQKFSMDISQNILQLMFSTCGLFVLCLFFKSAFINYLTYKTLLHSVEVYIQRKILIEGIYNIYVITTKVKGVLRKTKRIL